MKRIRVLLIALILILGGAFFSKSYAAERTLGANLVRPFTNSKYQYRVPGLTANGEVTDILYTIVKIYDSADKDENAQLLYSKALYCLRGGVGFGDDGETDIATSPITYSELGEMHTDAKSIIEKYKEYYNGVNIDRTETINEKEVNIYNAILWILDESYLPVNKEKYNAEEYKAELLDKAGISKNEEQRKAITEDDIEVIQQLAIWYFTNYDEQINGTKPTVSQSLMSPAARLIINGEDDFDGYRRSNLSKLYQYFINGAINNASSYTINTETGERTKTVEENKFDKNIETKITEKVFESSNPNLPNDEYYQIGPFSIDNEENRVGATKVDVTNIVLYDAEEKIIGHYYEFAENKVQQVVEFINESDISNLNAEAVTSLQKGFNYYVRINKMFIKDSGLESVMPNEERYDLTKIKLTVTSTYTLSTATFLIRESGDQPVVEIDKEKITTGDEIVVEPPKEFDLSLRKFITSIKRGETNVEIEEERVPKINTDTLVNGITNRDGTIEYTATYTHPKNALSVEKGDRVIYTIRVYNEGELDGTATIVTDYLPEGLQLVPASESTVNSNYGWTNPSGDGKTIVTEYLKNTTIKAFDISKTEEETGWQKATTGESGLYYADLQIECEVVAEISEEDKSLRNIAAITEDTGDDRDSLPGDPGRDDYNPPADNSTYKEDDDDYEDLVLPGKKFDLSLRKYVSAINGVEPETSRVPQIDTSKLNTIDSTTGKEITTAIYKHSKEPLTVKKGDIVTYRIRIYNEGKRDGYATKVTDYLPEGLGFLYTATGDINSDWFLSEGVDTTPLCGTDGIYESEEVVLKKNAYKEIFGDDVDLSNIQVIQGSKNEDGTRKMLSVTAGGTLGDTEIKATELIKAYGSEAEEGDLWQQSTNSEEDGLFYQELEITCIVLKENTYKGILKNVAEITAAEDSEGNKIINVGDDRDSEPNNVYQDQNHTPGEEVDNYTPGEQDDDDFEPLQLKYFDLALRKFITGVETNGKTENITSRIPEPKTGEDGNIVYEHTKEPVNVAQNDTVVYTIRVYNEGTIAGYAEEITDDIPEGLEYLPEHETNKEYEWVMIDKDGKVTETVEEAVKITTDYLSQAKGAEENLIDPFDSSKEISTEEPLNPDYKDVKVAFKVSEPNTSDRIIVNSAQISEDSDDDEDSIPDEWNEGEDDQDKEYIYVKYFDLSLLKWVTKTIVTVDGKTTITETGFKPNTGKTETTGIRENDETEPIAKVEIDRKKINKTTVKFAYKIRVTNEGEIAGYATEITDYIPEGLEFLEEDNKAYGWVKEGEDKVTTRALETVLLKPGESAEVEIIFTWKKDTKNLGLKTNIAEITEDYNENDAEDIDSVPDNKEDPYEQEQEDDDDFALVILSIKTGKGATYTLFITAMLILLASGMYLVKKYVLTY